MVVNFFDNITDQEITAVERILLPHNCSFNDEARDIIRCWKSAEIVACPGSGKTTVLLAKLKLLADRMPLKNGAGICVLSHTNVAVNEIKSRMAEEASKLLCYPNFVGTLQSFIDKYITLPYLRTATSVPIQFVDNTTYASRLKNLIWGNAKYSKLQWFIKCQCAQSNGRFKNESEFLQNVYQKEDGLYNGKKLAGNTSPSFSQYSDAIQQLLIEQGVLKFSDTYKYANIAIDSLDADYIDLFNRRFSYVFIDEYQDCDQMQRIVISRLFDSSKCVVIKIGDIDQSIFNGKQESQLWQPENVKYPLSYSNRYGQEIANVLVHLRTDKERIISSSGSTGIKPTLIIFDKGSIENVINAFISALNKNGLVNKQGIYKVIGKVKKEELQGLKISDYWNAFDSKSEKNNDNYWFYINNICEELKNKNLYRVEPIIRKLLCRILQLANIKNDNGKWYTVSSIKKRIDEKYYNNYREGILKLSALENFDRNIVDIQVKEIFNSLIRYNENGESVFDHLQSYFMTSSAPQEYTNSDNNILFDPYGRKIVFDTVHGVKGETHDATLYLETEENNGSDLKRVLPFLEDKKPVNNQTVHYINGHDTTAEFLLAYFYYFYENYKSITAPLRNSR